MPEATWCAAGIGAGQIVVNEWCIREGGHVRTGLEDNVRLDRTTLAPSNAALVERAARNSVNDSIDRSQQQLKLEAFSILKRYRTE